MEISCSSPSAPVMSPSLPYSLHFASRHGVGAVTVRVRLIQSGCRGVLRSSGLCWQSEHHGGAAVPVDLLALLAEEGECEVDAFDLAQRSLRPPEVGTRSPLRFRAGPVGRSVVG